MASVFLLGLNAAELNFADFARRYRDFKVQAPSVELLKTVYKNGGQGTRRVFLVQGAQGPEIAEGWFSGLSQNGNVYIESPSRDKAHTIAFSKILAMTESAIDVFDQYNKANWVAPVTKSEFKNRYSKFGAESPSRISYENWYGKHGLQSPRALLVLEGNQNKIVEGEVTLVVNDVVSLYDPKTNQTSKYPFRKILLATASPIDAYDRYNQGLEPQDTTPMDVKVMSPSCLWFSAFKRSH